MYTGPKLTNDSLVFGYDTGYGVFNKAKPLRFYKGEPATNVQDSDISAMTQTGFNNWGAYDGNNTPYHNYSSTTQTKTLVNIPGPDGKLTNAMLYHNVSGGSFGPTNWSGVPSTNLANGSKITLQAWVKAADASFVGKSVRPHLYYSKVGGGAYSASTNHSLTMDWQLVKHCYTVPEGATGSGTFYLFTGAGETKMYVTQTAIVPDKLNSVVWLQGGTTRSDTASLIDLKRTLSIDVGDVSFDSTGQPDFDGTDDRGVVENFPHIWNGSVSMECVVRWDDTSRSIIFGNYTVGANDVNFEQISGQLRFYWNRGERNEYSSTGALTRDGSKYHHCVFVRDIVSNNFKFYIDGVLDTTSSNNAGTNLNEASMPTNHNKFRIGADTRTGATVHNGAIPVIKVYSKALSTAEVAQNFNSYKNRFNL